MDSCYSISATTDIILKKHRHKLKEQFPTSYKEVFERIRVFIAFVETYMHNHKDVENPSKRFIAPIHSEVLGKFFKHGETRIIKFLREEGLIKVEPAIRTEVYKKPARYDSPTAFMGRNQHSVNVEMADNLESLIEEYYKKNHPELPEDLKKEEAKYKELFVNWTKADNVFRNVYRISLEDLKAIRVSDNPMKNEYRDALMTLNNLEKLQGKKFHLVQKYGRLYTVYHSLKKEFRNCIEHNYEEVVECFDMTASFPTIVALMGCKYYSEGEYAHAEKATDIKNFYNACKSGDIYSKVLPEGMSRKEGKTHFLSICFADNANRNWKLAIADIVYNLDDEKRNRVTSIVNKVSKQFENVSFNLTKITVNYSSEKLIHDIANLKPNSSNQPIPPHNKQTMKGRKYQVKKSVNSTSNLSRKEIYLANIMKIKNALKITEVIRSLNAFCPSFYDFIYDFSSFSQKWNGIMREYIMAHCIKPEGKGFLPIQYKNLHGISKINLSIEAQKIESMLFTRYMTQVLEAKHPDIFAITLHDAVFTTESMSRKIDKKVLRALAYQILENAIMPGYKFPKLADHPVFKIAPVSSKIVA